MLSSYTENLSCIRSFVFQTFEKQFKELAHKKIVNAFTAKFNVLRCTLGAAHFAII